MPIEKEQIIRTAIHILDRDGLEGVTLRRLATELHIQAASIYWHLPDKEALLDEMANEILMERFGDYDFANDRREWTQWLDLFAHELRAAMLAHREGGRVVAGAHLHIAVMLTKLLDLSVRVLHNAGFTYGKAATIIVTVKDFCFGFVIEEQAAPRVDDVAALQPLLTKKYPGIAGAMASQEQEDNSVQFDTAMRIIINGARSEL
jgi:TetR/AcrR family tetracycline transcriptional repressor